MSAQPSPTTPSTPYPILPFSRDSTASSTADVVTARAQAKPVRQTAREILPPKKPSKRTKLIGGDITSVQPIQVVGAPSLQAVQVNDQISPITLSAQVTASWGTPHANRAKKRVVLKPIITAIPSGSVLNRVSTSGILKNNRIDQNTGVLPGSSTLISNGDAASTRPACTSNGDAASTRPACTLSLDTSSHITAESDIPQYHHQNTIVNKYEKSIGEGAVLLINLRAREIESQEMLEQDMALVDASRILVSMSQCDTPRQGTSPSEELQTMQDLSVSNRAASSTSTDTIHSVNSMACPTKHIQPMHQISAPASTPSTLNHDPPTHPVQTLHQVPGHLHPHSQANPPPSPTEYQKVLEHLSLTLFPLISVTTQTPHPEFPTTMLAYNLLTHDQLDRLSMWYHQVEPPVPESWEYPIRVRGWVSMGGEGQDDTDNNKKRKLDNGGGTDLCTKRRRFGRFIGLLGCESPVDGPASGDGIGVMDGINEAGEGNQDQEETVSQRMERDWLANLQRMEEERKLQEKIYRDWF